MASVVAANLSKSMAFGVLLLASTGVSGQAPVDYFAGFGSFETGATSP